MFQLALSKGHGPNTPGKRSPDGRLREYSFNSAVVSHIVEMLKDYEVDILVLGEDSRDVPLKERTDKANSWGADAYVSIHANASGVPGWDSTAHGIETYIYTAVTNTSKAYVLAANVQTELIRETGRKNRGVKRASFHEIRETHMPAILVEGGFMTHPEECELLESDAYRQKVAKAVVTGFINTYKIPKKVKVSIPKGPKAILPDGRTVDVVLFEGKSYAKITDIYEGHEIKWDAETQTVKVVK